MNAKTRYPSLAGKNVLITGAATGIGAAMVKAFSEQRAKVIFFDIDTDAAEALCQQIVADGYSKPEYQAVDVTDVPALQRSVHSCGNISILVNNVANDMRHSINELTEQEWHKCMAVNLNAAFFSAQAVYPQMKATGSGTIINISSINALLGPEKMAGYVTAKEGLLGLTRALASDFGSTNIRVNAILPGWVATERQLTTWLTPEAEAEWKKQVRLKQRLLPEDIARLVLFLAADDSAMITGQQFVIDAGRT